MQTSIWKLRRSALGPDCVKTRKWPSEIVFQLENFFANAMLPATDRLWFRRPHAAH